MIRRLWKPIFRLAFWLPSIEQELAQLPAGSDPDAARWHIWRRLFRTPRYWWLCAAALVGMPLLMWAGAQTVAILANRSTAPPVWFALAFMGYTAVLMVAAAFLLFQPLKVLVRRELRQYLRSSGVMVCVSCGYDLRGQAEGRCSECGQPAP